MLYLLLSEVRLVLLLQIDHLSANLVHTPRAAAVLQSLSERDNACKKNKYASSRDNIMP